MAQQQRPAPTEVRRVGVLGCGVIGSSWACHFLRYGLEVVAYDSAPGAEARLRARVAELWPQLEQLGLKPGAGINNLSFASSIGELGQQVALIQESTPENLEAKQQLLAELDAAIPAHVVIASSTSGFPMSDLQTLCRRPERTVVCHPFTPPHIVPFCEVVGGAKTEPAVVDWAAQFFQHFGKEVAKMERELHGFIGNRLQDAIWREALHMVANGECSVADIDKSIATGPGLRWAIFGPCMNMAMCGGEGGMARMLDHFGPSLKEPWTRLQAPELDDQLYRAMVEGTDEMLAGRSMLEVLQERDELLIRIRKTIDDYRREKTKQVAD
ncbi:MAG: 3-hydroxyacyl-CoA dehydrogenase NAD-binding domain-containing protein [Cellvibrionaceae bacterium]|nr:3-hydroxyacyl-CoA dehydrogenase NAD-binding domain-containing protein [Cellvibrionaceae bacterium]